MRKRKKRLPCCSMAAAFCLALLHFASFSEAAIVGINYGMLGNDLPAPTQVVSLLNSRNISLVRIYNPDEDALNALQGSGIQVILGTYNQDLQSLANNMSFATDWVQTNVVPYKNTVNFRCISAGNEVIPGDLASFVLPAMTNLYAALQNCGLGEVPVSTAVSMAVLGTSYPPSQGKFSSDVSSIMGSITSFLAAKQSPLLVNVYPYFAYISNQDQISLSYALFNSTEAVVHDGNLAYYNLFDAMVDSVYSALENAGGPSVELIVSESGWPSDQNGEIATIQYAEMYNNRLVEHILNGTGTPKKPGQGLETCMFAIFNENLKPAGTEQHFGLYYPNMTEVYPVNFVH